MKDVARGDVTIARVAHYCDRLQTSLERLHEAVADRDEAYRHRQALRAAKKGPGMQFNTGDYVLVPSHGNVANPRKQSKVMVG